VHDAHALEPTTDDRTMAMIGHALTFIEGGIIGPLIMYLVKKDDSEFVAFHSLQSLYFGLLFLAVAIGTCGIGAILFVIPYLVFEVIACIEAQRGNWYKLPLVGGWAMEVHHP
jgi:hypothetical protein